MSDDVLVETADGVAVVTLNRPERLNAISDGWVEGVIEAFDFLSDAADVRAVVVRGEGRAFCAGGDLVGHPVFAIDDDEERLAHVRRAYEILHAIRALPAPVIAAVHGLCIGAGVSLALACDLRIAAADARFSLAFVKLGLLPDMGATVHLPGVVGMAKAMELSLLGDFVDATEAHRLGLVNRVVAEDELLDEAKALAGRIASLSPHATTAVKRSLYELASLPRDEAFAEESATMSRLLATPESRAAIAAFASKRTA